MSDTLPFRSIGEIASLLMMGMSGNTGTSADIALPFDPDASENKTASEAALTASTRLTDERLTGDDHG